MKIFPIICVFVPLIAIALFALNIIYPVEFSWVANLRPEKTDYIWSAGVGAFSALLAAYLTNKVSLDRQMGDQRHERDESERERQHELKKDVYLPIAEAMPKAMAFLTLAPTLPLSEVAPLGPLQQYAGMLPKLLLVAPADVIEPAFKIAGIMSGLAQRLVVGCMKVDALTNKISRILHQSDESTRALAESNLLMESGKATQNDVVELARRLEESERMSMERKRLRKLIPEKLSTQLELIDTTIESLKSLPGYATSMQVAIRKDLSLQIDGVWLANFQEENAKNAFEMLRVFRNSIDEQIKADEMAESERVAVPREAPMQ